MVIMEQIVLMEKGQTSQLNAALISTNKDHKFANNFKNVIKIAYIVVIKNVNFVMKELFYLIMNVLYRKFLQLHIRVILNKTVEMELCKFMKNVMIEIQMNLMVVINVNSHVIQIVIIAFKESARLVKRVLF